MFSETILMSSRSPDISSRIGWTTRHGPHHGAQKSTRTGSVESSTSAWKLLSVTWGRFAISVLLVGGAWGSVYIDLISRTGGRGVLGHLTTQNEVLEAPQAQREPRR